MTMTANRTLFLWSALLLLFLGSSPSAVVTPFSWRRLSDSRGRSTIRDNKSNSIHSHSHSHSHRHRYMRPNRGLQATTLDSNDRSSENSCQKSVDEIGSTVYFPTFEPCTLTLYEVPSAPTATKALSGERSENDTVPYAEGHGLLESCWSGYVLETLQGDDLMDWSWDDPCVGLETRCYGWPSLTSSQRATIRDMISDSIGRIEETDITHVRVDCTLDSRRQLYYDDAKEAAGVALFVVLIIIICFWCEALVLLTIGGTMGVPLVCWLLEKLRHPPRGPRPVQARAVPVVARPVTAIATPVVVATESSIPIASKVEAAIANPN